MKRILVLLSFIFFNSNLSADDVKANEKKETYTEEKVETEHTILINGVEIPYKATAGTLLLKNEKDETKASFFYIAYTKNGESENSKRPITFCFNGGPGSSSIWLHMGVFGPKRIGLDINGTAQPPYNLIDNEYSFLDMTDLVFVDPISTGYSRVLGMTEAKEFHGVDEDVKSVAEFIRLYTTRNARWDSPKFLAGESYGTTRAAALANYLHDENYYYVNGIFLISTVLNFQTLDWSAGNDLPYILFLPSYTATAWYHNKLDKALQQNLENTLKEAENFALNEYALSLMQGDQIDDARREEIIKKLSYFTGLSPTYIERANLRISMARFSKELLRDEKRTIGRFDGRFKGIDADACGETYSYDPSAEAVIGAFTAAFNEYARKELKWEKDAEYKVLANVFPWNFGKASNKYLNVTDSLRDVMTKNTALKVFVANGYYDLATPYFATDYTFNHLGLDPSLRDHVTMEYYPAGHMMYIHLPSLEKFKKDSAEFLKKTMEKN